MNQKLSEHIMGLIKSASTDLPPDVEQSLVDARDRELEGSMSFSAFDAILENTKMAREFTTPICQDTGSLLFYIDVPVGTDTDPLKRSIQIAADRATREYLLRPNAVDPITGKNSGNNIGLNAPYFHFHQWERDDFRFRLMLKGGGSENVGTQYKLPDAGLQAGRDLKGIKKCVIDAVFKAQGKGCAPGIIGVGIGGDRVSSYELSKEVLLRKFGERSEDPVLAEAEVELFNQLNALGIGPMGFGGKTTVLEVFCGKYHRHPATFFVTISYMCWACRRKTLILSKGDFDND
ncbi:fumarate hydratase [bacterium]|nr:fumarate hydratase [bacterium]